MSFYRVQLFKEHPKYNIVKFRRSLPNNKNYHVVTVNIVKFLDLFKKRNDEYVIPDFDHWQSAKRVGLLKFLDPSSGAPEMPRVVIRYEDFSVLLGLWSKKEIITGFVSGRHRMHYIAANGGIHAPVETHINYKDLLIRHCT
jgi:hypothetical protein